MAALQTIPVGVIVARERIDHPWQDHRWSAVRVELNADPGRAWEELSRRGEDYVEYLAAVVPVELYRTEVPGYIENLEAAAPSVYVVLRDAGGADDGWPVSVHMATVSPHDAEAYGASGFETIHPVAMPAPLREALIAFVTAHPPKDKFKKRKRGEHDRVDEHLFGQEPIHVLRERMARRGRKDGEGA